MFLPTRYSNDIQVFGKEIASVRHSTYSLRTWLYVTMTIDTPVEAGLKAESLRSQIHPAGGLASSRLFECVNWTRHFRC